MIVTKTWHSNLGRRYIWACSLKAYSYDGKKVMMAGIWSPWIHRREKMNTGSQLSYFYPVVMLSTFRVGPFTPTQFIGCLTDRFSVELTASIHHLKKPVLLYIAYYLNLTFFPLKSSMSFVFLKGRERMRRWLQERPG